MLFSPVVSTLPRKTRVARNEPGHAHFVTFSCFQRFPLLTRVRTRRWVVEATEGMRRRLDVAIRAYVIMPEHVHVLLYARRATYEMRQVLVGLKRPVSGAARVYLQRSQSTRWIDRLTVRYPSWTVFRFWQPGGGFDRNIFREKTVPGVIGYMQNNPFRRGLVDDQMDWVWSSARFWDGQTDVPLHLR